MKIFQFIFRLGKTKLFSHVMLNVQYRMHPTIASFPSDKFYEGQLKNGIDCADRPLIAGFEWPSGNYSCNWKNEIK